MRKIKEIIQSRATSDGAGVKLNRVFGGNQPQRFDPFLLLDEFNSDEAADYIAGFPEHPHRGFETVTYMLEGNMEHEDNLGNKGLLRNGDVQWMTAAHGIIHSEMPKQIEGKMRGFQLWVNLPAAEKMKSASWKDIPGASIPEISQQDLYVKVIAGEVDINSSKVKGAVSGISTDPLYLDIHLVAGKQVSIPVVDGHTALIYVYEGSIQVVDAERAVSKGELAILSKEGIVSFQSNEVARVLLLAGKPLGEPIAQYGPFVMNTPQEIEQAIEDYRNGVLTASNVD